jgi:6-phosphogluconolactonase (cycloisomerase 2 family)
MDGESHRDLGDFRNDACRNIRFSRRGSMMPSKRTCLVFIAMGLAALVGCGSGSTHTAYVALPDSNAVAALRIKTHLNSNSTLDSLQFTNIVGSPFPAGNSPTAVLVHPSGQFIYVANQSENDISLFTIDSAIGSLQEVLPRTPTGLTPIALAMDKGGNYLFALNRISGSISVYSINSGSGALTSVAGSPFGTFTNSVALAITPSAKFLYVLNPNVASVFAYTINAGVLQPVAGLPVQVGNGPLAIAVDPAETFVYVVNSVDNTVSVLSINSSTGALTLLGSFPTGTTPTSVVALDPYLYVTNLGSSNISEFTVTPTTGVLTQITDSPVAAGTAPLFAVIDPNNLFLYVGSQTAKSITAFVIDTATGALTSTSQAAVTNTSPSSMSVSK